MATSLVWRPYTLVQGNAFKVHWRLLSIDGLLVGHRSRLRCLCFVEPILDGLSDSHGGEQANLPDVCLLPVKIERWILGADYV